MLRSVTFFILLAVLFFLGGCGSNGEERGARETAHLMNDGSTLRGIRHPDSAQNRTISYPENSALKIRELEMAHRERLAAIEAEKAKALKALELEKLRSVEAIRQRTKEIETQNALKLEKEKRKYAALIAEKERTIKALEVNASLHRDTTQTTIAKMETKNRLTLETLKGKYEENIALLQKELKEKYLWAALAFFILLLLFRWFFYRYRKAVEAKQREEERQHEAWLLESRQQHERIEKILEIIASSETEKEVKVELTRLLQRGIVDGDDPKLIEYKKSEELGIRN